MATVYIAIGSNIDPEENLKQCAGFLRKTWGVAIEFSDVCKTAAMEVEDQDYFLNAAAKINTDMSMRDVFLRMQAIERLLEKAPPYRFGPRTIDLDLLLYDEEVSEAEDMLVPHPRFHNRRFVLEPLLDVLEEGCMHPTLNVLVKDLYPDTLDQDCDAYELEL